MSNLTVFQFESHEVRVIISNLEPWFIAAGVAKALSITRSTLSERIIRMPDAWKRLESLDTLDVRSNLTSKTWLIREPGVYELIFRSDKPEARQFQILVFEEILPAIRKTGKYPVPQLQEEPQPQPLPTPTEISKVIDIMLGKTDLHPNLIAGAKGSAIAQLHPHLLPVIESAKTLLPIPVEEHWLNTLLPCEFVPNRTYSGMTPDQVQILLRVNRELALQRFLSDYLLPLLAKRGYSLRNLLQALGSAAFDDNKVVAHHLWDAVASLDTIQLSC